MKKTLLCCSAAFILTALSWFSSLFGVHSAYAQNTELTSSDNLALLYVHQLGFTSAGAPQVRIRIDDGLERLLFAPKGEIRVLPNGKGGPSFFLPGGRTYEIRLVQARAGVYQYGTVVARGDQQQRTALDQARQICADSQIETEIVPIGAVFALHGNVFDNRENLLMTKRVSDRKTAEMDMQKIHRLSNTEVFQTLNLDSGDVELYTELKQYPEGTLSFTDVSSGIRIENRNLLWIDLPEAGAVLHGMKTESGSREDILLNGSIIVTSDSQGKLAVVQSADIETILRGIVPKEIYASAPEEALMAQAIAARTTLIAQAGARHLSDPYHLCNRQHCQVYAGLSGSDARTDKAIEKSRGLVMFYDNKLIQSYYSASCGGFSAGSSETWGLPERPYLVSRTDDAQEAKCAFKTESDFMQWWNRPPSSFCASAPEGQKSFSSTKHARWTSSLSGAEIEESARKLGHEIGRLTGIEILERGASYRVRRVRIIGTKGQFEIAYELQIRRFFGGLKSALFGLKVTHSSGSISNVEFYGAGFGHGVGMCQTGAVGMAQRGKSAENILMHYFPGARIKKLWHPL